MDKGINAVDILKRDCFNKLDTIAKIIKNKLDNKLTVDNKKKVVKKLGIIILISNTDNLYLQLTGKSGLESIFEILGFENDFAKKLKNIGIGGGTFLTLLSLIYKYLKEEVK